MSRGAPQGEGVYIDYQRLNLRIVEFPPEADYLDQVSAEDAANAFGEMAAADALAGGSSGGGATQNPFMHKTETLDFAIVVAGETYLVRVRAVV